VGDEIIMRLATQDRSFFGSSFEEKLITVQRLGFEGLEIGGDVLINRFPEIQKAVSTTEIPISSICGGYRGWIGAFNNEERKQAISDIGEIMKYCAEIGASGVIVPAAFGIFSKKLPPFSPPRTEQEDNEVLEDSLHRLDALGKAAGTHLLLEPLNRYEDHMINTLEQAKQLIAAGGYSQVKVLADFFHMNIEEKNISESIFSVGDMLGHVHLADSNRLMPGQGHIDFEAGLKALQSIDYKGFLSIECEVKGDGEKVYKESALYLKSLLDSKVV
jgi:sugar phosphate isomerase/epimerase